MPRLYSFVYEFQEDCHRVTFYDGKYDIIKAESLAQIPHQARRKWAQNLFSIFRADPELVQLEIHHNELDQNEFSKRLYNEGWNVYSVVLERLQPRNHLHIYRLYFFNFKNFLRNLSPALF